ncbi:MAG: hypothetical protein JSW11_00325 [Candidatus Heimdallarchaeota archaeon]|nr:MAG: hypothetical protein JSW11_00325 [Candidatus Heimdallarchaeota archaeon]
MSKIKYKRLSMNPEALKTLAECTKDNLTDKEIQQRLVTIYDYKWNIGTISRQRRAMGIIKTPGKSTDTENINISILNIPPHGLSETEKAYWFRGQFKQTHMYKTICRQFEPQEVETYLEDFGLLCCQFEDIVISEFMQIDDFLKHRILINQQLILKRDIQKQINILQQWFIDNPKMHDQSKEEIQFRISQQRMLDDKYRYLKAVEDRYDALVKERQRIYNSLAATRKDRIEELSGGKETFFELVSKLQHSQEERNKQGRFAELIKIAAEDVKEEFRKPVTFPDDTVDYIIMDSNTDFGE